MFALYQHTEVSATERYLSMYVAAVWSLGAKDGAPTTIRSLIDLAWDTFKQQRPDVVELLKRAEPADNE